MAKKIQGYIKLMIGAGKANPSPPVGPALGQRGLNIMDFCKAFNAATQKEDPGTPIPVVITVYADRTFSFITKKPPVSYYIKKAAKVQKGSKQTGKEAPVAKITAEQVREIAQIKMEDMNAFTVESAYNMIKGSAVSMGIEVVE
jgi:large subunit ribosomal protein L11